MAGLWLVTLMFALDDAQEPDQAYLSAHEGRPPFQRAGISELRSSTERGTCGPAPCGVAVSEAPSTAHHPGNPHQPAAEAQPEQHTVGAGPRGEAEHEGRRSAERPHRGEDELSAPSPVLSVVAAAVVATPQGPQDQREQHPASEYGSRAQTEQGPNEVTANRTSMVGHARAAHAPDGASPTSVRQ